MASRKPTSTTQRRQNLLKSTYLTSGGRHITNGLFRIDSQTLTEVNKLTGRTRTGSYFLVRDNLREALQRAQMPSADNLISTYYNGTAGVTRFRVRVTPESVSIGCKTFTGKAAEALKAWALIE